MATLSPLPPTSLAPAIGLDQFRAALPDGTGEGRVADALCALGAAAQLARGQELAPDPETDRLVWLASGAAKLVARGPASVATGAPGGQVLAFHFAGDLVSVLRQKDGDFRLVALTPCDLVIFPSDAFLDHAQGDPVVLRSVLTRSLQALHRSRTRMMQMGHKSAAARIADFLVSMAERLADCTAGTCAFALPMSRRDIGDSLGLTIETVSRQLTELREAGLVETEGRSKVALTDVAALARIAGRRPEPEDGGKN
ncbi:Crp/Fnr family transcriptional regulator [Erythrobacter sp. CCH5-A1]|jgi:CRP/FNR family transcriptional regulator|uniref:Crp/Fnr family transcriptional regulator n=1 Tax=Erythrobacter sp. CCH5-A1 TaxID=1768792 RepID=UPI000830ECAA|nr:helix-turn-helix domain-containing protein [Erythrobacter sp. CCH5-A1]